MMIEVALMVSLLGLAVSLYFNINNNNGSARAENRQDASAITTVIVKLENIGSDVKEIKMEMSAMQDEQKKLIERVAIVEQASKSGHKRLDEFYERLERLESRVPNIVF